MPYISAAQCNTIAQDVIKTLNEGHNEESFNLFWVMLLKRKDSLNDEEPEFYWKRKVLAKRDFSRSSTTYFPSNAKEQYRNVYFAAYDATIESVKERFNQEDCKKYTRLQVKGELWADEMETATAIYKEGFSRLQLEGQLPLHR